MHVMASEHREDQEPYLCPYSGLLLTHKNIVLYCIYFFTVFILKLYKVFTGKNTLSSEVNSVAKTFVQYTSLN